MFKRVPGISIALFVSMLLVLTGCAAMTDTEKPDLDIHSNPKLDASSSDSKFSSSLENRTPEELTKQGWYYLANRNVTLASLHFANALKKDPQYASAYTGLALIDQSKEDYRSALASYNKALSIEPDQLQALLGKTQVLRLQGMIDPAVEVLNRAMNVAPDDVRVINELAIIYDVTGKENLAESLYQEVIEKSPMQASSYNNLGMNYMIKGMYTEAIIEFHRANNFDTRNQKVKNNLATAYVLNGDRDAALQLFKETVGEAGAYNNIGYLLMTQGKFDEAEKALRYAMEINPKYYERAQENLDRLNQLRMQEKYSR